MNTDLVCDAINTAMRELFLQIVYGRTQSAFSGAVFLVGKGRDLMGAERELLEKIAVVQKKGVIGAEDLLIGHPLGTQRDRFKALPAAIEVIEGLVLKISDLCRWLSTGGILPWPSRQRYLFVSILIRLVS